VDDTGLVVGVAFAMAIGVAGTVVPFVPGLGLVWVAGLAYGLGAGFGAVGWSAFVAMTILMLAGFAAGVVLPHRAARAGGATTSSVGVGAVAAVVGFFVVPVVGLVLGGVLGIFAGETLRTRDVRAAWRSTVATVKGFGLASLAQLAVGLLMAVTWLAWVVAS
jgi:uncharacterized protein YqgC (DUF456 family)